MTPENEARQPYARRSQQFRNTGLRQCSAGSKRLSTRARTITSRGACHPASSPRETPSTRLSPIFRKPSLLTLGGGPRGNRHRAGPRSAHHFRAAARDAYPLSCGDCRAAGALSELRQPHGFRETLHTRTLPHRAPERVIAVTMFTNIAPAT